MHSYHAQPHTVAHTLTVQAQPLEMYVSGSIKKEIAQFLFKKKQTIDSEKKVILGKKSEKIKAAHLADFYHLSQFRLS